MRQQCQKCSAWYTVEDGTHVCVPKKVTWADWVKMIYKARDHGIFIDVHENGRYIMISGNVPKVILIGFASPEYVPSLVHAELERQLKNKLENNPTIKVNTDPEPFLIRDDKRLTGEEMTQYHKAHGTASYHCILCGAETLGVGPCPICRRTPPADILLHQENAFNKRKIYRK